LSVEEKKKLCKQCGRPHKATFSFLIEPEEIIRLQRLDCHLQLPNYIGSMVKDNKTIDVFYEEPKDDFHCSLCGKWISRETSMKYNGLCSNCAMLYVYWDDDF
jgi:hypothetical protein